MATQLTFKSHVLEAIEHDGKSWFTATTLAIALEYSRGDKITQIYNRNADEFTPCMSINLKLRFNGLNNSLREKAVRVFSLRGAHLIAMFASTPVAKEFRKWVLDLIDKEFARELPTPINEDASPVKEKLPAGVYFQGGKYNPYRASATIDGKYIHIGVYPTVEDAVIARMEYLRKHHVESVVRNNPDLVPLAHVRTRLLIEFEGTHAESTRILHPDAITATPDNLPDVLREYGWGRISIEQHQRIIEACVEVIARKCKVSVK